MDRIRSVADSLAVFNVFPMTNKLHLITNISTLPVNWSQLSSLTEDDLFQEGFVGLTSLQEIITNMVCAHVTC